MPTLCYQNLRDTLHRLEQGETPCPAMRAAAIQELAAMCGHEAPLMPLTEKKKQALIEQGYQLSGYVLQGVEGKRALVEMAAVRWLSNDEMQQLMHPFSPIPQPHEPAGLTD